MSRADRRTCFKNKHMSSRDQSPSTYSILTSLSIGNPLHIQFLIAHCTALVFQAMLSQLLDQGEVRKKKVGDKTFPVWIFLPRTRAPSNPETEML